MLLSDEPDDVIIAARHLNAAVSQLDAPAERMDLAGLNLRAARRARQTAAFRLALELATAGLECLPPDADDCDHSLVFDLHLAATEAAWITGDLASMHALIGAARALHTTVLDRAELAYLEMKGLVAAERPGGSPGRRADRPRGDGRSVPGEAAAQPRPRGAARGAAASARAVRRTTALLPQATDAEALAVQKLLAEMFGPSYMAEPDLWPLLALRCLRVTLDSGRAPVSPVAFAGYGLLLGVTGRYEQARRFGDLALTMAEHPDCREFRPWTKFLYFDFIHHWTRPAADAIEPLRDAIREALLIGDLENAGFMTAVELYQSFSYGVPLPEIDARGAELAVYLRPYGVQFGLSEETRQLVQNLMGRSPDPLQLVGDTAYDERVAVPAAVGRGDVTALSSYHLTKLGLHFIFGDFAGAVAHADAGEKFLAGMRGTPNVPIFHATNALVGCAPRRATVRRGARSAAPTRVPRLAPTLSRNYEGPWLLMEAEVARAHGDVRRAEELYDQTITAADRAGLVITAALAREYCGDLYAREGRDRVASAYLNAAMEGWSSLGADGKVEQLCRDYPSLLRPAASELADSDAQSLLELTNAMVSEVVLDDLLERLLSTIASVTDTQRGVLFAHDGVGLVPAVVFEHGQILEMVPPPT